MAAMPMSEELQFNVLRGVLPGGEHGIVFHDVKIVEDGRSVGMQYMTQIAGSKGGFLRENIKFWMPGGDLLDRTRLFKFPHTTAAIRLPGGVGPRASG